MHDFVEVCQQNGIYTRVVECNLEVEFSYCDDEARFIKEYDGLCYDHLQKWFLQLQSKDKGANPAILEILMELYKKVLEIEKQLKKEKTPLIPLDARGMILALGHEVLWIQDGGLELGATYYLRFVLPNFSDRIMAVFARALSANALLITKMHPKDIQDFDGFVVAKEMEKIRWQKQVRGKQDE